MTDHEPFAQPVYERVHIQAPIERVEGRSIGTKASDVPSSRSMTASLTIIASIPMFAGAGIRAGSLPPRRTALRKINPAE
jgi:hypothetical protein